MAKVMSISAISVKLILSLFGFSSDKFTQNFPKLQLSRH